MRNILVSAASAAFAAAIAAPARAGGTVVVCQASLSVPPAAVACAGVGVVLHELLISDKPFGPNGELMKIILAPVDIVVGNVEAAPRESGEVAKILRGITGVSVDAINKNGGVFGGGLSGGENSFFRKNLGIRF